MPFTSTQISGLVGGQQVMFSNQAAFANQIGGNGDSSSRMANPYPSPSYGVAGLDPGSPDIGTKLAGGAMMALPAMAAGTSMAGSMMGYSNPLGLLDPFTGVSRAFGAGTGGTAMARTGVMAGNQGMGLGYAWGNISGAFAKGGLRAGMGAVGGGLAGAAIGMAPYAAIGAAIDYTAQNMYQGVQNVQDVRRMSSQYFEPQYGKPGARTGGAPGMGMAKNISSFMHELVSEDTMSSMTDMRRMMDKAGSMGMLQGIGDVNQFKEKFRNIVKATKGVASILGSTLEEAMPLVNQLQQMGMWTAKDVMGTAATVKAAGPGGAAAVMGAMQQGAQMSYQMGGRLDSGAKLGQELFGNVTAATRAGVFSQQDIRNMTGGVGGAEGQRMVAGNLQSTMAGFGQTAMGRLMMAGLGEMKGKEFTGNMDKALLEKFNRGEIDVGELQAMGQKRIHSSQTSAVSFFNKADELGQSMAQQGGMVSMAQGVKQAMARSGHSGDDPAKQNRFIQMITGSSQKQADMIQKLIQGLPQMQAEQERSESAALEDSFRQLDEKKNHSMEGLKMALEHSFHEAVGRPLQELGESVTTRMSESIDRFSDKLMGRTRAMPKISMEQGAMLAQAGAVGNAKDWSSIGFAGAGEDWLKQGGANSLEGIIGNLNSGGLGAALDPFSGSSRVRALKSLGLKTSATPGSAGDVETSEGFINIPEAELFARRAAMRSSDATVGNLLGGETAEKRKNMETVKAKMRALFNSPASSRELQRLKKEDPQAYHQKLLTEMKKDPSVREAMDALGEKGVGGASNTDLDIMAISQNELGYNDSSHAVDYAALSKAAGIPTDPKEVAEYRNENIERMANSTTDKGVWKMLQRGLTGGLLGDENQISATDLTKALESGAYSASDIADYAAGKTDGRFAKAANSGDDQAKKIMEYLNTASEGQKKSFIEGLGKETLIRGNQYLKERQEKLKSVAGAQGPILSIKGIKNEPLTRGLEDARKLLASGDVKSGEDIISKLASGDLSKDEISTLLSGKGGVAGKQVGRLAKINNMGEMDAEQATKFMNELGAGDVDFMKTPGVADKMREMLSGDNKISGSEVGELKKLLSDVAPAALGAEPGGKKSAAEEAQIKFIEANERFVRAVDSALSGASIKLGESAAKDVVENNPSKLAGST
jgi:hypothetical protein